MLRFLWLDTSAVFVYNYLLVRLPSIVFDTYWCFTCFDSEVTRLDGSVPIKYGIRLNMDEKYKALKKELSRLTSIPPDQVLFVEIMGPIVKVKSDGSYSFHPVLFRCAMVSMMDTEADFWVLSCMILAYLPTLTILWIILNLFSWCKYFNSTFLRISW